MEVQAPNGDVYDLPDAVASGLAASEGWSLVDAAKDEPAPRARSRRSAKN